ncbi:MAG TPA: extensin family protein [Xanthobacteraceae bacterium]|nr:extensin family protein [Xanthobacteraceae bacterium]
MKVLPSLIIRVTLCALALADVVAARAVPSPRSRPAQAPGAAQPAPPAAEASEPEEPPPPSACRLRLTAELAVVQSAPPVVARGECGIEDGVRLEAVFLRDKTRVALTPPAIVRCTFAEAIVQWVREDLAPAVRPLGAPLRSLDNYAAYDCRGRNRIVGAKLSEHGKANAIDVRSVKLANGIVVGLTDPQVGKDLRLGLRKSTCARFTTVLGPGSDGYHEDHVHVDLAERHGGHRMCQWDVREPGEEPAAAVPLPVPRPASANHDDKD